MTAAGPVIADVGAGAFAAQHRSTGALFWRGPPAEVTAARRRPGWAAFHRAAGRHGLFFDDIEPVSSGRRAARSGGFRAATFRLERRRSFYLSFRVSEGRGLGPIEACADALRAAASAGFPVPVELADLLTETAPAPSVVSMAALLGDEPDAAISIEDLLG
jgi:hypothetical protein